ncbi:hypothetical protein PENTCL1PPCAC_13605, partial [Pristionchus entomophagus]
TLSVSFHTFSPISSNRFEMGIFSLPDVCLWEIMARVTLQDRLRLRLVCRAFEKLVAGTNAGRFETGSIKRWTTKIRRGRRGSVDGDSGVIVRLDDLEFKLSEDRLCLLLQLRHRLFTGISFECFEMKMSHAPFRDVRIKVRNTGRVSSSYTLSSMSKNERVCRIYNSQQLKRHRYCLGRTRALIMKR